jgi:hypothetical protein
MRLQAVLQWLLGRLLLTWLPHPSQHQSYPCKRSDTCYYLSRHNTASSSLTYLVGCRVASCDYYQVCYLWHSMVLAEAANDAELVLWDSGEFGH